ncbi:hypothetical protein LPJ53_000864 [Coemansia erecta]|uniref:polynucleotide adenylyltransferase n=1 Tax=Coemansia erecta TaxID=147472 RepID=A0A9W7Y681_9FUNG|nr:hypothetical protein LPJ53_000864 [Coemansia erecta]
MTLETTAAVTTLPATSPPTDRQTEDYIAFASSSSSEEDEEQDSIAGEDGVILVEDTDDEQGHGARGTKRKADDSDEEVAAVNPAYNTTYDGHPLPPWLKGHKRLGNGSHPDIPDMINDEVEKFVDFISPTAEEHEMRTMVIRRLQRVLDSIPLSGIRPEAICFGSFDTKLYLPTSDVDMAVMLYDEGTDKLSRMYDSKPQVVQFLGSLARALKKDGFCRSCEVLARARVPIIKAVEMVSGIHVDISINTESGFDSAKVQKSFCDRVYPDAVRSLVLIIKQFLYQRSMNEVYTGGIGSYAITLLVVSMLQMHPRIKSGGLDIKKNLGVLLIEFFELYGKKFNYERVCISVRENGQYLDKRSKGFHQYERPFFLSIEDPCDETNDVSRGSYSIWQIRQTFSGAYDMLNNAIYAYHQTREYGEPINDTLKAVAAEEPSRKRARGTNGRVETKTNRAQFNSDPWAPVSFLSSILAIKPSVIAARESLKAKYLKGTMQQILGDSSPTRDKP